MYERHWRRSISEYITKEKKCTYRLDLTKINIDIQQRWTCYCSSLEKLSPPTVGGLDAKANSAPQRPRGRVSLFSSNLYLWLDSRDEVQDVQDKKVENDERC